MWKNYEVDENTKYTVALCQSSNGRRYFDLVQVGASYDNSDLISMTDIVSYDLLFRRNFEGIVCSAKFSNGMNFGVDAHGIWLTQEEIEAFQNGVSHEKTNWLNGLPPNFPQC